MDNKALRKLTRKERAYVIELTEKGNWTISEVLKKMRGFFLFFLFILMVMVIAGLNDIINAPGDRLFSYSMSIMMVVIVAVLIAPVRIGAKVLLFRLI